MWTGCYLLALIFLRSIGVHHCSQNLARGKQATSNEVIPSKPSWTALRAVDGDRNQNIWCGSCLHTYHIGATVAYLMIDLSSLSSIKRVEIYYRVPYIRERCAQNTIDTSNTEQNYRFKGYEIHISNISTIPSDNRSSCFEDESSPYPDLYQNNSCVGTGRFLWILQRRINTVESILKGPLLELCEVEVIGCVIGRYGPDCSLSCENCFDEVCDLDNGKCTNGCNDGYTGEKCDQECSKGFYGKGCLQRCGVNCIDNDCHHASGRCLRGCQSGYRGDTCDQECLNGTFGINCSQTCGNCRNSVSSCNHVSGSCPSSLCADGYRGELCKEECESKKYGFECSQTCGKCRNDEPCHHVTGFCLDRCAAGWSGRKCQDKCMAFWYGEDCGQRCNGNCYQNVTCNNEDGACEKCAKGYKGLKCDEECGNGTYGVDCKFNCGQCNVGECDKKEGTCRSGCRTGWQPPYCAQRIVADDPNSPPIGIIAGAVAAIVVLALVLIAIFVIRRKRGRQDKDKKGTSATVSFDKGMSEKELVYANTSAGVKINSANEVKTPPKYDFIGDEDEETGEGDEQMYTNTNSVKLGKTEMKVSELRSRITDKMKDSVFNNEYSHLERGAVHPHEIGKDPKNKSKNRFLTTFPYDHSLVKLSTAEYINANYIDGIVSRKQYIATQGPKPSTLEDFWRMVWEHNTGKIVMLANIIELGKKKCEQYWPAKKGKTVAVGPYQITLKDEKIYGAYIVRELKLKEKEGNDVRTVYQFHYTTWPDHGTPDVMQFVDFLHATESKITKCNGPKVVHCSAGIGRTGTYIALDELSEWIKKNSIVNVFGYVQTMRKNRMNMIQNLEQYVVLHQTLVEVQLLEDSMIPRSEFPNIWDKQLKRDLPKNQQRCIKEYQKLHSLRPEVDDASKEDALSDENRQKNREMGVIPLKKYRPYLSSHSASRTDYINAVMLPSKAAQTAFLATQYPMSDTLEDFWCLVYDHESPYIVVLEPDNESIDPFPQTSQSVLHGNVHVKQISTESAKIVTERIVEIQKKNTSETKQVHVLEETNWSWGKALPASPTSMVSFIQRVFEWSHGQSTAYPITVVCFDGSTKCGLFCALYNILENLTDTGEVDVFRAVRELQLRRPEFICDLKQYEFLYETVHEFLEQSSIYANT